MKKITTLFLFVLSANLFSQTTIQNGDFELWQNVGTATEEPTFFILTKQEQIGQLAVLRLVFEITQRFMEELIQ